jgi:pimeloyl-ACP methyl ester carboxylesterase
LKPLELDSADFAHWGVDLRGLNWQTSTRYDFLRLESFIRSDMAMPTLWFVLRGVLWFLGDLVSGAQYRIFRASWRFGLHLLYFQLLLLAWAAISAAIAGVLGRVAASYSGSAIAGAIVAIVALVLLVFGLRPIAEWTGAIQIGNCWLVLRRFCRGQSTWLDRAIEAGASDLVAAARANDADELVVIGHSSGCVVASAIMARALELDPDLGRGGPRLVLLTLGSVMPAVALHPAAQRMRNIVRQLAVAPTLSWIDCQSRKDVMCFTNFDPVDGIGLDGGMDRRNPLLWRIRFREMIAPENYGRFRWSYLRVHYQYILAGDRPAPYDYMLLVAGPAPIAEWPKRHRQLMDVFIRDAEPEAEIDRQDAAVAACL